MGRPNYLGYDTAGDLWDALWCEFCGAGWFEECNLTKHLNSEANMTKKERQRERIIEDHHDGRHIGPNRHPDCVECDRASEQEVEARPCH